MLYWLALDYPYWEERSTEYRIFSDEECALDAFYGAVAKSIMDETEPPHTYIWLDVMEDNGGEYRKTSTLREWDYYKYIDSLEEIRHLVKAEKETEKAKDFEVESLKTKLSGFLIGIPALLKQGGTR